jgi:hypothetical protein
VLPVPQKESTNDYKACWSSHAGPSGQWSGSSIKKNIVDAALVVGFFNSGVKAMQAATNRNPGSSCAVHRLRTHRPAFPMLPAGWVESRLKRENKSKTRAILTCHLGAGKVPLAKVIMLSSRKAVNGQELGSQRRRQRHGQQCSRREGRHSRPDGMIHVIDTVILLDAH